MTKSDSRKEFDIVSKKVKALENGKLVGLKCKCSILHCDNQAVYRAYPLWLNAFYCEKHGKIIHSFFNGNANRVKCLNDDLRNFILLKRFIEFNKGKSFTCLELHALFLGQNKSYCGGLSNEPYFKSCLRKFNIPCLIKGNGSSALIYSCIFPCNFKGKYFEKEVNVFEKSINK